MTFNIKTVLLLLAFSSFSFAFSNFIFEGSLHAPIRLSGELKSPPDSLYQWNIGNEAPFSYRVLHRTIVTTIYQTLRGGEDNNQLFFYTYLFTAFAFQTLSIFLFFLFLNKIGLQKEAILGAALFAVLPAFLLAYNSPVHTREDMLAYAILVTGLMMILDNSVILLLGVCVLGVLCRETLLIIPFVNLFFNHRQKIMYRLGIALIPFGVFVMIRYIKGGAYDHLEGFRWNMLHIAQVICFAFITFGVLWVPFIFSFLKSKKTVSGNETPMDLIHRSAPWVLALILLTTFFGGIFNEIRLLYLLAPWVIPIAITYFKERSYLLSNLFSIQYYKWTVIVSLFIMILVTTYFLIHIADFIAPSKYAIPYEPWIIVSLIQVFLAVVLLPIFFFKRREVTP